MMRPTLSILLILLVLITPVTAAILTTPPMVTAGGREFSCTVVNVTELPVGLEVELRGTDGSVLLESGSVLLEPGGTFRLFAGGSGLLHCRFIVGASRKSVRAAAALAEGSSANTMAIVPAQ